jgi:hypothetical protein
MATASSSQRFQHLTCSSLVWQIGSYDAAPTGGLRSSVANVATDSQVRLRTALLSACAVRRQVLPRAGAGLRVVALRPGPSP